jgi:hypothetical protein
MAYITLNPFFCQEIAQGVGRKPASDARREREASSRRVHSPTLDYKPQRYSLAPMQALALAMDAYSLQKLRHTQAVPLVKATQTRW